jgi:hypothetical protein
MPNPEWDNYTPDSEKAIQLIELLGWYRDHQHLPMTQLTRTPDGRFTNYADLIMAELSDRFQLGPLCE